MSGVDGDGGDRGLAWATTDRTIKEYLFSSYNPRYWADERQTDCTGWYTYWRQANQTEQ